MFLAQLDRFAVRAEVAIDEVLLDGQKIQFSKRVEIRADPPTKLWAVSESKLAHLEYFYDGETFSLYTRGVPRVESVCKCTGARAPLSRIDGYFKVDPDPK